MKLLKCYQDYLGRKFIEDIKKKNQAEELKTTKQYSISLLTPASHDMLALHISTSPLPNSTPFYCLICSDH